MAHDLADELQQNIPLSEMLQTLRTELGAALEAGRDAPLQFDVEQVDLELQVKLAKTTEGEGKASIWVVSIGGSEESTRETAHTFKLRLKPRWKEGAGPVRICGAEDKLPG